MKTNEIVLGIQTDLEVIAKDEPTSRIVELEIQAPVAKDANQRQPLNLALVLDRSGSMHGNKLYYAKQAALHVVDMLEDSDQLAVVVFDDRVDVLTQSIPLTSQNKQQIKNLLHQVECGGSTFLSGGWLSGCQLIAAAAQPNTINRVLLLSDGQANAGITDIEELSQHARELANRGIATSTFGVGHDFNEHLMETMSNQGQGNFYFIETPQDIPNIFASEFKELSAITAREVELKVNLPIDATCEILGGYAAKKTKKQLVIPIGSMYSGKSQVVYLRIQLPASPTEQDQVLKASVYARGEEGELLEASGELSYTQVSKEELDKAPKNIQMLQRFSSVELAEVSAQALKLERKGQNIEASNLLRDAVAASASYTDADIQEQYLSQSQRMLRVMTEADRKTSHYDNYRVRRMQHRGMDYFHLEIIAGHLVMRVERFRDVLDTGSPVSIGSIPKFLFMGENYPLAPAYSGVDMDVISQQLGKPVDALLGMDVLCNYHIYINLSLNRVMFSNNLLPNIQGESIPVKLMMNIPVIELEVNGITQNLFLDTGSPLNYLAAEFTKGMQPVDTAKDTYPGIGEFTTSIYELPVNIAGVTLPFRFGVLPKQLEISMLVNGITGILGTELYRNFNVLLAFPESRVVLAPFDTH